MSKKMLIDASHPEETRVVVVDGTRVEELDFESENKRQLRGNVYLARVTRVEPSLQAAFVEYGGNRHGFLAFSEIHPDYYQIPQEDRQALLEAEQAESLEEAETEELEAAKASNTSDRSDDDHDDDTAAETEDDHNDSDSEASDDDNGNDDDSDDVADATEKEVEEEQAKMLGARKKRISKRRYKIQEVIKRGQILLIQAVKEERGNKGAAMTTYLSLAGRYCVLMPNTPRGGGISRKIPNGADRKRLRSVMSELSVPKGMGVIVRTAGASRTKAEIKRDYDYLSRLWDTIRKTTLESIAPSLIHEEGNLVKRSIRDLYGKEINQVLVQGDDAYKVAKNFIKMLMPSHAKNVQPYKDDIPLLLRYQVEQQIEACLDPVAQLKSGGYLVIHPTEALVSVDVNSGRSTKERNVERTALKTNLEAAEEVARQMRLRDLAGLIVIDFIDMDENRNNRAVEKRMRDVLSRDRARVQMGKISQFGLMEISRQRRRRSLLEGSTASCEHCAGVGRKRSVESSALRAVRAVEEEGIRSRAKRIRIRVAPDVANYLFNEKRSLLNDVDNSFDMFTEVIADPQLIRPNYEIVRLESKENGGKDPLDEIQKEHRKERSKSSNRRNQKQKSDKRDDADDDKDLETAKSDDDGSRKPKRRRGRRGGRGRRSGSNERSIENQSGSSSPDTPNTDKKDSAKKANDKKDSAKQDGNQDKSKPESKGKASENDGDTKAVDETDAPKPRRARKTPAKQAKSKPEVSETSGEKPKPKRKKTTQNKPQSKPQSKSQSKAKPSAKTKTPNAKAENAKGADAKAEKPKRKRTTAKPAAVKAKTTSKAQEKPNGDKAAKPAAAEKSEPKPEISKPGAKAEDKKPKKRGWWSKRKPE